MFIIEILPILAIVEIIVFIFFALKHVINTIIWNIKGIKTEQIKIKILGSILSFIGIFGANWLIQYLDLENNHDDSGMIYGFFFTIIGFLLFYIGIKFRVASYKKPEETPIWINWIMNFWSKGLFQ